MGNTLMKHGTMTVRISKAFAGGPGGQFSRKEPPWSPKALKTIDKTGQFIYDDAFGFRY
jgi:hypothetical protein